MANRLSAIDICGNQVERQIEFRCQENLILESCFYFPNVFIVTSNNSIERINRTFGPINICQNISYYLLKIYDRWGNIVFESTDMLLKWNGTFKESYVSQDVYYFSLEYSIDNETAFVNGNVTVLRN